MKVDDRSTPIDKIALRFAVSRNEEHIEVTVLPAGGRRA